MMDGLDQYHHDPMLWAVEVVIMQLEQMDANPRDQSSIIKVLNDGAYEFISACFEDEEIKCPSVKEITKATLQRTNKFNV